MGKTNGHAVYRRVERADDHPISGMQTADERALAVSTHHLHLPQTQDRAVLLVDGSPYDAVVTQGVARQLDDLRQRVALDGDLDKRPGQERRARP